MKKYIIITHTIYNLGGGQLLTLRKKKILNRLGYEVIIVFKKKRGPFILEKEYEDIPTLYIPEFDLPLNLISSKKREECLDDVIKFIGSTSHDSIIESNDISTSVWAEIIAQKLNLRHIYYLIIETKFSSFKYYPYKDFFEYKLRRNEVWACNSKGLEISYERRIRECYNFFINVPFDTTEIPSESNPNIDYGNWNIGKKIVITTISRLDKKYVVDLFNAVKKICTRNAKINIELIIIGDNVVGQNKQWLEKQKESLPSNVPNMNLILPGYIKSVGKDFYAHTDLFVGMGTSIISAISQGCISLNVNPYTSLTSGILGIETFNFAFNDNGKEQSLEEKIEEIIKFNHQEIKQKIIDFYCHNYSIEAYTRKYLELLNLCEGSLYYFDFKHRKRYILVDRLTHLCSHLWKTIRCQNA